MKTKFFSAILLVVMLCSSAYASLPSVTMLSTKTCPACTQMAKVLRQIDKDYGGRIETRHIYLEDEPELAERYRVRYVPMLIFKDAKGREVAREVGYRSKGEVLKIFANKGVTIKGAEK